MQCHKVCNPCVCSTKVNKLDIIKLMFLVIDFYSLSLALLSCKPIDDTDTKYFNQEYFGRIRIGQFERTKC